MNISAKLRNALNATLAVLAVPAVAQASPPADSLRTTAERSNFVSTGRYDEVQRLCSEFASRWPAQARCFEFGRTPEGRPMLALAVSADGTLAPEQVRARHRPVLLFQAGIHAGEIDGKDAGFMVLRDLLTNPPAASPLASLTVVFVPVFNVDGHERFGAWNRPNQRGPAQMGWRATAQNLNLNRDYMKADAPEMQAMQRLLNDWDPLVYSDLHVTDGADFQHDVSITVSPEQEGDTEIAAAAARLRDAVIVDLNSHGSSALPYYPEFVIDDDPQSGFAVTPSLPRFSTGYRGLSNRMAVLVETHSWKDYATRVRIMRNYFQALLRLASTEAPHWQQQAVDADARAAALAAQSVPLAFANSDTVRSVPFRAYAYQRRPSAVSGALMTVYDPAKPVLLNLPMRDEVRVTQQANAPRAGYLIPAAYAAALTPKLRDHGIAFKVLNAAHANVALQSWRATAVKRAAETFEGHTMFTLTGNWANEARDLAAGSVFVPIAQAKARLIMSLLEPTAPDSYAAWGFFATAFERKEYMEPYVAEQVALQMLRDPAVNAAFIDKLATDKEFPRDADARLGFFYRRHPSWDERYDLYPVYRLDATPAG